MFLREISACASLRMDRQHLSALYVVAGEKRDGVYFNVN